MRKIFTIFILVLLLIACKGTSRESIIKERSDVKLYLAMNDGTTYADTVFKGAEAATIADLVRSECPQGVNETFARVVMDAKASTLVIYSSEDGNKIFCSVLKPKEGKGIVLKSFTEAPNNTTAVLVNGKTITIAQLQQAVAALPQSTPRDANNLNIVVNQLINAELLRQEAAKYDVTNAEVAAERQKELALANVTEEQAKKNLEAQGKTMQDFDDAIKESLQMQKLYSKRLLWDQFNVSDEDAKAFYMNNPNQFLQSEQAIARYLLVASKGRTLEQGQARAQEIFAQVNTTDFCVLVKTYSDDSASKDKCGVYVVPRGVLDPNLELASFSTQANKTSVVTTDAGIYFVQTLQVVPPQVVPYPQVAATLQTNLRNAILQQRANLYLQTLRSQADIVSYLG